jgi:hypothetical protein
VPTRNCPAPDRGKQPRPAFPFVSCCFLATGALPVRTVGHAPKLKPAPTVVPTPEARAVVPQAQHVAASPRHGPSPPLYILHCVWLC